MWATKLSLKIYVLNSNCSSSSYLTPLTPPLRKSGFFRRQQLAKRIRRLERRLNYTEHTTASRQSKLSLKQLERRVDRLERKLERNKQKSIKLSTKACLRFLFPEAKHWHNIGILLDIPESILEQIECDYLGSCQDCVREMIKTWLKQVDPLPNWSDLAEAVQVVNPSLAKKILKLVTDSSHWYDSWWCYNIRSSNSR